MCSCIRQLCVILLLLASSSFCVAEGRKLAVVVGVNTYRGNSGLPNLGHAASDAEQLSSALRLQGFTVYEMTHEAAREAGHETQSPNIAYIRDQIDGILGFPNLGADDAVLISLHGHGVQFEQVSEAGERTPKFYFCPADATISEIKTANELTERNHLLPLEELYSQLGRCTAATKLLIVDACRNDPTQPGVFRNGLASATLPKLPPPPGGTAAFFSCKANQRAVEDPTLQQGVFTHFLVQGLQGAADQRFANKPADGVITLAELSAYVANNTYAHVYDKYHVRQSPELRGEFDLNLPLGKVSPKPTAAGIEFVRIEPGSFLMGAQDEGGGEDEKPHRVTITKPFFVGKYEVTVGQVLTWLNSPGAQIKGNWVQDGIGVSPVRKSGSQWVLDQSHAFGKSVELPMQNISWDGAVAFCKWCSLQDPNFTYRLPSEAEWEYMARAGSTTSYPWGVSLNGTQANVDGRYAHRTGVKGSYLEIDGPYLGKTVKVGSYDPNFWGVHDVIGNVSEWCIDYYDENYYSISPGQDPPGPTKGYARVLRGGSWSTPCAESRSASRDMYFGFGVDDFSGIGFRVVAE